MVDPVNFRHLPDFQKLQLRMLKKLGATGTKWRPIVPECPKWKFVKWQLPFVPQTWRENDPDLWQRLWSMIQDTSQGTQGVRRDGVPGKDSKKAIISSKKGNMNALNFSLACRISSFLLIWIGCVMQKREQLWDSHDLFWTLIIAAYGGLPSWTGRYEGGSFYFEDKSQ